MRGVTLVTVLALALPLVPRSEAAPIGAVAVLDRVVARVGGVAIWQSEVEMRMRTQKGEAREAILTTLIDEALILAEARRAHITVEPSEVAAALEEIKAQNAIDDKELDEALVDQGFTRASYLVDLERQILILRTRNQHVSPRVHIADAAIDDAAAGRGWFKPYTDAQREELRKELRQKAIEREAVGWLAELRKKTLIERKP